MATPFMNLDLPTPTVTLGPEWATELNAAMDTIDAHDHTNSKGALIPVAGLSIDSDLDFNAFSITNLKTVNLELQGSILDGASYINSVQVFDGDLYFTNGAGVAVQVTSGSSLPSVPTTVDTFEYLEINTNLTIGAADITVYINVDTTAIRTITLPLANSVSPGRFYYINDKDGLSNTNNITIATAGGDLIQGSTSFLVDSNYSAITLVSDGAGQWLVS